MRVSRRPRASSGEPREDLDNVLQSLNIPVALLGRDLRVRRVALMEDTPLALSAADIGRPLRDIRKKLRLPELEAAARQALRTGAWREFEISGEDGRWHKLRVRPYEGAGGKIEGVVLALLDIDVAKRALFQLQDVMEQALLILDGRMRVQSANLFFYDYFHLAPRQARGRALRELAGGQWNDARLNARLKNTLVSGTPFAGFEQERNYRGLGRRLLRIGAVRVLNESRASLFVTIMDITELRRSEALERLEENERIQREFVANVSHELRTPVTAIKGFAQTLKRGGVEDRKNRLSFIGTIERHSDRLGRLIEKLLRISVLSEQTRPRVRKVPLRAFIKDNASDLSVLAKKARVSLILRIPPGLSAAADPSLLVDVFQNLIGNAIKFNRPGGRVEILAKAAGTEAVVTVKDTGIGIPARDLPRLFQRFYRGRNVRALQGAGLGLSIVRQVAAAHGGRAWAESALNEGSAFHVTLPLWRAR